MRNILFQVARIVVTFILLVILFTRINWAVFFQNVYHANYFLIAIATLLGYAGIYISVLVWNIFLKRKHLHLSKGQLFSVYLAGSFFNNFLPTSFGGDAFKIVHLRLKHPGQDAAIVSSIFFQRVCGFLALLTSNLCLALLFYTLVRSDWRLSVIEVIIFLGFLALVLFIRFHKFIHYIQKLFRGRIAKKVGAFIQDILTVEQNRDIYVGVFYSVIFVLLAAVAQLLYFNSLGVNPNFLYIFFCYNNRPDSGRFTDFA
jgi:uncharacterized protein (TIRG00374 family)